MNMKVSQVWQKTARDLYVGNVSKKDANHLEEKVRKLREDISIIKARNMGDPIAEQARDDTQEKEFKCNERETCKV